MKEILENKNNIIKKNILECFSDNDLIKYGSYLGNITILYNPYDLFPLLKNFSLENFININQPLNILLK